MTNTLRKPSWDLNTVAGSFQVFCEQLRVSWESAAPHPSVLHCCSIPNPTSYSHRNCNISKLHIMDRSASNEMLNDGSARKVNRDPLHSLCSFSFRDALIHVCNVQPSPKCRTSRTEIC